MLKKKDNNRNGEILILKNIDEFHSEIITDNSRKYPVGTIINLPDGNEAVIEKEINDQIKVIKSVNCLFDLNYLEKFGNVPIRLI